MLPRQISRTRSRVDVADAFVSGTATACLDTNSGKEVFFFSQLVIQANK